MVKVFQLIVKEQHIILNSMLIKEMRVPKTIMGVVRRMVKLHDGSQARFAIQFSEIAILQVTL
jgi:hypothetical protein